MASCHRQVVAANISNEKVGVIHVIPGVFPLANVWARGRRHSGRGLKKLDIFQSKQKEGSDDVKSDRPDEEGVGWGGGCRIFSGHLVHAHTQRNSVELLTTSPEDGRKGV